MVGSATGDPSAIHHLLQFAAQSLLDLLYTHTSGKNIESAVQVQAARLGLADNAVFLERLPDDNSMLRGIDLVVLPSLRETVHRVIKLHVVQREENYGGRRPDREGVFRINECTFAYDYLSQFQSAGFLVADHRRDGPYLASF